MGEGEKNTEMVAYINGQPVELPPPEVKMLEAEEPCQQIATMEDLRRAAEVVTAVWHGFTITLEAASKVCADLWAKIRQAEELQTAIRWAEVFNRPLFNRYRHTKKRRIRKKYAKRILAWYQEEVPG